jgi:hypothetical protein
VLYHFDSTLGSAGIAWESIWKLGLSTTRNIENKG